jgi:hypothetical protein
MEVLPVVTPPAQFDTVLGDVVLFRPVPSPGIGMTLDARHVVRIVDGVQDLEPVFLGRTKIEVAHI